MPTTEPASPSGATAVITHHVKPQHRAAYEQWLEQISALCRRAPGFADWQAIRPIAGISGVFTMVIRFSDEAMLRLWMNSPERKDFIERAKPYLEKDDDFYIRTGLDFWFAPTEAKAKLPVAWKQYLVTWSAIFPLSLLIQVAVMPPLHQIGFPRNPVLDVLVSTGMAVALLVFLVMPRYTKLVRKWLFR